MHFVYFYFRVPKVYCWVYILKGVLFSKKNNSFQLVFSREKRNPVNIFFMSELSETRLKVKAEQSFLLQVNEQFV